MTPATSATSSVFRMIECIKYFFKSGYRYSEILQLLHVCLGIKLSQRHLKRILRRNQLYRKKHFSDILDVALYIIEQLKTSAQNHGYKWFHQRAIHHGFVVTQKTIRELLILLDEDGVNFRKRRTLNRRMYHTNGPNAIWHMDGYDKLKPYGICIHGCIDGFSRKVMWLHAAKTNNDPYVIAGYFMDSVQLHGGCPERVRGDFGTENIIVKEFQTQLRTRHFDNFAAERSFMYGKSTSNQRIESWWGQLRRHGIQFWMDLFHKLQYDGFYTGSFLDKNLLQFCFMGLLQEELDKVVDAWNHHRIRKARSNNHLPCGRPFLMYTVPEKYGGVECKKPVNENLYQELYSISTKKGNPCDDAVFELCCILIAEHKWTSPSDFQTATDLYMDLRNEITSLL